MRKDGKNYVTQTTKTLPDERTDRENLPVFLFFTAAITPLPVPKKNFAEIYHETKRFHIFAT